tara:strand:- start:423 stop:566 length:144 start_codon:yes stop_codon:yes gene_type:complete
MKMLVNVNISKGFNVWLEMARLLNPEMEKLELNWYGQEPILMRIKYL